MKFTQKRTCKNCHLEGDYDNCTVFRIPEFAYGPDMPKEPCFKPMTISENRIFMESMAEVQKANLEIERTNNDKQNS